ncbi:hypothetical protein SAMN05216387_1096 [Nitrosovibrio tenuis]|uniref:Uncharacterized protein n=1 Tax=Nitrosovibrio tenuis TaxID=1233 RepID=A0A1H7PE95_9PROT|nr:hypothetical protein SAMN05216387_1096 [Nitrosovibrio tenuis]
MNRDFFILNLAKILPENFTYCLLLGKERLPGNTGLSKKTFICLKKAAQDACPNVFQCILHFVHLDNSNDLSILIKVFLPLAWHSPLFQNEESS